MIVWLELTEAGSAPRRFRLQRGEIRVGAGSRNDIVLRSHGAPVRAWTLRAAGGVLDVEAHVEHEAPATLAPGDALTLGDVELRVDDVRVEAELHVRPLDVRLPPVTEEGLTRELASASAAFAVRTVNVTAAAEFAAAALDCVRRLARDVGWIAISLPDGDDVAWSSLLTLGAPSGAPTPSSWWNTADDGVAALRDGRCVCAQDERASVLSIPVRDGTSLGLVASVPVSGDVEASSFWSALPALLPVLEAFARRYPAIAEREAIEEENRYYRDRQRRHYLMKDLVANAERTRALHAELRRVLACGEPVLMTGEAGTGKELLARAIHHLGGRSRGLLIAQHCGTLDEDSLDYELFGHAPTGDGPAGASRRGVLELADGGTVFLDEVHLLSSRLQMKLLRVLSEAEIFRIGEPQARSVDVRIVAATHLDLMALADEGRFRRDLALALTRAVLEVPPLRERREDIPTLTDIFVRQFARRYRAAAQSVDDDTMAWLVGQPWPGNVRELQTVVERAVLHAARDQVVLNRDDFTLV